MSNEACNWKIATEFTAHATVVLDKTHVYYYNALFQLAHATHNTAQLRMQTIPPTQRKSCLRPLKEDSPQGLFNNGKQCTRNAASPSPK